MLYSLITILALSTLIFFGLDLVRYSAPDTWRPINWLVTTAILPFVLCTNVVLLLWNLLEGLRWSYAWELTFGDLWEDIKDAYKAGW